MKPFLLIVAMQADGRVSAIARGDVHELVDEEVHGNDDGDPYAAAKRAAVRAIDGLRGKRDHAESEARRIDVVAVDGADPLNPRNVN